MFYRITRMGNGSVVKFHVGGELAVLQSLDQVDLPQGPVAIQQLAVQSRYQGEQFPVTPRLGQGRMAYVVIDVQAVIGLPVGGTEQAEDSAEAFAPR